MVDSRPIVVNTVTEAVYQRMRDLLLTGVFAPGQWIRERDLTETLGVSRTPVREALRLLERDRLVIAESRKGFRIPIPSVKEITDFYELRTELEGFAAARAARQVSHAELADLRQLISDAQTALSQENRAELIALNNRFHDVVAKASGNQALADMLGKLRTNVNLFRVLSWSSRRERPATTLSQHRLILEAIEQRNEAKARTRAKDHIMDSLPLTLAGLEQKGTPVPPPQVPDCRKGVDTTDDID